MKYKLKKSEGIYLMVNLLCAKLFLLTPYLLKRASVTNVSFLITVVFLPYLIVFILKSRKIELKRMNKPILFIIWVCLTVYLSFTVYEYAGVIRTMFFDNTPIWFIVAFLAFTMIYTASRGLKAIGKLCGFFVPFVYFVCVLLVTLAFKNFNPDYLFPFFGSKESMLKHSLLMLSVPGECIIYYLLPSVLEKRENFKSIFYTSFFISFALFLIVCLSYVMAGFEQTEIMPMFMLIRLIKIKSFFQRVDLIFLLLFVISVFLYLSSILYFACKCFADSTGVGDEKFVALPVGLIASFPLFARISRNYIPYILIFMIILPLFMRRTKA